MRVPSPVLPLILLSFLYGSCASSPPPSSPAQRVIPEVEPSRPIPVEAVRLWIRGSMYEDRGVYDSAAFFYHHALRVDEDPWLRYSLARCLDAMDLGDHALAVLRPVAALPSLPPPPAFLLAEFYMDRGEMDSASALLRRFPELPEARALLADALLDRDPRAARDLYREILDIDPEAEGSALGLALAWQRLGACDSAVAEARDRDRRLSDQRTTAILLALGLACAGDSVEALAVYERHLADAPPDVETVMEFSTICRVRGEPARALDLLERGYSDPDLEDADALRLLSAMAALAREHLLLAPGVLAFVRDELPEWEDAWSPRFELAQLLSATGQPEEACRHMDTLALRFPAAMEAMPALTELHLGLCNLTGRFADVPRLMHEREVRSLAPTPAMLQALGYACSRLGRFEDAEQAYRRWLALDRTNATALGAQAETLAALGRHTESDSLYDAAIGLLLLSSSSDSFAYLALLSNNYAYGLAERSEHLDRALDLTSRAVAEDSLNSAYLDTRAWVLHKSGRSSEALPLLLSALRLREKESSSPAVLYHHLGDIHLSLGNRAEARRAWKRALDGDPTNSVLKKKLHDTR